MSAERSASRVAGVVRRQGRVDGRVPDATVARLATYLRVLGSLGDRAITTVSSEELAAAAGVNSAKLRKDLSFLGSYGIRGVGYHVATLTEEIARTLGITVHRSVALIGVGNLGQALAGYAGFASRGFRIAALIDADPATHRDHDPRPGRARHRRPRADRVRGADHHRRARHARLGRPGPVRPARRRRGHQHPQLRPGRAVGARARGRPQGRPRRRTADPVLPRDPQGRRRHLARRWAIR